MARRSRAGDGGVLRGGGRDRARARARGIRCRRLGHAQREPARNPRPARRHGCARAAARPRRALATTASTALSTTPWRPSGSRRPGEQCGRQPAAARGRRHGGGMGRGDRHQLDRRVLSHPAGRPALDCGRAARLRRQYRVGARAGGRFRTLDLRYLQGGDHPHDPNAGDRMGRACDPRQRDRARTDADRLAVAPGTGSDPAYMAAMLARIPLHRLTTSEEVAAAVCWLASPEAASITGHTLVMDGGLTAA